MTSKLQGLSRFWLSAGWRKTAMINTVLIWLFTIILLVLLCVSAIGFRYTDTYTDTYSDSSADIDISTKAQAPGISVIYSGSCSYSSKVDIGIHVFANAIGTLILASSNFFMQILTAPTRQAIDLGHQRGDFLEVGVQSLRNLTRRFFSRTKALFWLLLNLSSIPIHLFLNASVYTAHVSTENFLVVAAEPFLNGADFEIPGIGADSYDWDNPGTDFPYSGRMERATKFIDEVAANATSWSNMSISACMDIYNDPGHALRKYRNVVMIVQEPGNSSTIGWRTSQVRLGLNPSNQSDLVNSLFLMLNLLMTDDFIQWCEAGVGLGKSFTEEDQLASWIRLDLKTRIMNPKFTSDPAELEAMYCLSEPIEEACEVRVSNITLLVVCVFSFLKALVCLATMITFRHDNPLVTPGDAIDSFISSPDVSTSGMCWAGTPAKNLARNERHAQWNAGPKEWQGHTRRLGCIVPGGLWVSSYLLFAIFLGIGVGLLVEGSRTQPINRSTFGPTSQTLGHNLNITPGRSDDMGDIHRALFANLPHLALAIAYFAYNNIITRMLSECELSEFGCRFLPLRVSAPRGSQRGTHRLQLPYSWSIPLMTMSGFLHWLLSNCVFPKVNIAYEAYPPYGVSFWSGRGLGFSTLAIFITVVICSCAILIPIFLARKKLRKDMIVFASHSIVISSACHVMLPGTDYYEGDIDTALIQSGHQSDKWRRSAMAANELRWGVVMPNQHGYPGHLSFGTKEQYFGPPQAGHYYAGEALI